MKSKKIKLMVSIFTTALLVTSCSLKPADSSNTDTENTKKTESTKSTGIKTNANNVSSSNSIMTKSSSNATPQVNSSNAGNNNVSNASSNMITKTENTNQQFLDLPLPSEGTVSKAALDKFVEGLKGLESNKVEYTWNRKDNQIDTKGQLVFDVLYKEGAPDLIKTEEKSFANSESEEPIASHIWYRNMEKFMVEENGKYVEHSAAETEDTGNYDFSGLITKALSFKEATEDEMDYTVSIETDNEAFIKETMGLLGYVRNGAEDWKSDMIMEIVIDKETGHAKAITYQVTQKETKNVDSGNIIFTQNNEIEKFTMPEAGDEVPGATTNEGTTDAEPEAETEGEYQGEYEGEGEAE